MQRLRANFALRGRYRWSILDQFGQPSYGFDQDGRKVYGGEWHDNLITKYGMNRIGTNGPRPNRTYLHVGEGALVVEDDSGAITASQAGTTVTASAAIFSAANVGDLILWDSGESSLIATYTDSTHVEVTKSATVASGLFTIKHTGIIQLVSEADTSSSNGGFGDSNNYYADGAAKLLVGEETTTRVVTATADRNYTEFGFSADGVATHLEIVELFRDSGGTPITLTIPSGKKLRLDHALVKTAPYEQVTEHYDLQSYDLLGNALGVTAATNASPIQITTNFDHGLATGDQVQISGVLGNTAANGIFTVTVIDATNFTLDGSTGNGAYTSGGTIALYVEAISCPFLQGTTGGAVAAYLYNLLNPADVSNNQRTVYRGGAFTIQSDFTGWTYDSGMAIAEGNYTQAEAYVADSMERTKGNTFAEAQAVGSIYVIELEFFSSSKASHQSVLVNPKPFTKANTNTLKVRFKLSWWWSF